MVVAVDRYTPVSTLSFRVLPERAGPVADGALECSPQGLSSLDHTIS